MGGLPLRARSEMVRAEVRGRCRGRAASGGVARTFSILILGTVRAAAPVVGCNGCSGRGVCLADGSCLCDSGYWGDSCEQASGWNTECAKDCAHHGQCRHGTCLCDPGYSGHACEEVTPTCPHNCGGHGRCEHQVCSCFAGYTGDACLQVAAICQNGCSGHGVCAAGKCECDAGYTGQDRSRAA